MAGRIVRAEELNAVLENLQPKLAAADQEELRGVGGDETVSERHPPLSDRKLRWTLKCMLLCLVVNNCTWFLSACHAVQFEQGRFQYVRVPELC